MIDRKSMPHDLDIFEFSLVSQNEINSSIFQIPINQYNLRIQEYQIKFIFRTQVMVFKKKRHMAKIADLVLLTIDASIGWEMETFEFLSILD